MLFIFNSMSPTLTTKNKAVGSANVKYYSINKNFNGKLSRLSRFDRCTNGS